MKYRYIDAIRGLAILLVMIVHTSKYGADNYPEFVKPFMEAGARGVQMFFIASAFTLFLSHNNRMKKERYADRNFFIRRFFRIAPMYYIGICYYLFQNGLGPTFWVGEAGRITAGNIIGNALFIHGINPAWINSIVPGGWSITVEMTFYLTIPILVRKLKNLNAAMIFTIVTLFISLSIRFIFLQYPLISNYELWKEFLYFYFPTQLPVFGLGMVAYFLIYKKDISVKPFTVVVLAAIVVAHFIWKVVLPNFFFAGIGFLILMYALSQKEFGLFVNRFTTYLGKVSYSSYIVHFAVLHWMNEIHFISYLPGDNPLISVANFGIRLVFVIIFTMLISTLFYHAVEVPFQNLGKRIISKYEKQKPE